MAEINFLPVCMNCYNIILREVNYEEDVCETINIIKPTKTYSITPPSCPYCGKLFTKITIPTKLPFQKELQHDRT